LAPPTQSGSGQGLDPTHPLARSLSFSSQARASSSPHGAALLQLFPGRSRTSPALVRWALDLLVASNNPLRLDLILLASRACPRPRNPSCSRADSAAAGLLRCSPALPLCFSARPATSTRRGPAQVVPWRHLCRHCRRPPSSPRRPNICELPLSLTPSGLLLSLSPSCSMRCWSLAFVGDALLVVSMLIHL
jgi:hypothetical protein